MNNKSDNIKNNKNGERRTKDLQSLSMTILPFAQSILGKNGFVETDIISNWSEIVGDKLAQFSFPQKIDFPRNKKNNGCLHLTVPSGAFAVEIQHREKYILDKINTYFGYNAVSSLRIIQNNEMCLDDYRLKKNKLKNLPQLNETEKAEIKSLSDDINNQNLKEILIKLGHSIYADNHKTEK